MPSSLLAILHSKPGQRHIETPEGVALAIDSEEPFIVIPKDFDVGSIMILHNVVDRCSTGAAGLALLLGRGASFMVVSWGIYDDGWNSARNAAKRMNRIT